MKSDFKAPKFVYMLNIRRTGHHTDSSSGAPSNFLARMVTGTGRFIGEGHDLTFVPCDMYFIPRGFRYHSYWTGEPVSWHSLAFDWIPESVDYLPQKLNPTLAQIREYESLIGNWRFDSSHIGRFYSLFSSLSTGMKTPVENKPSATFGTASELLASEFGLSVGEVAKRCKISESGLFAEFRKYGTTPVKYRQQCQIDQANRLLATTDLTVEEISERCGFTSAAYFYRVFKRLTGKTTREVRGENMM